MQHTIQKYIEEIRHKIQAGKRHPHIVEIIENKATPLSTQNFHVDLILVMDLSKKQTHTKQTHHNPFIPPFDEGKFVMDLGDDHCLLFNKFPVQLGHVLICTKQFQMQHAPLSFEDLRQTLAVVKALNGIYFFNGGKSAGTSQPHRHIQCLPQQSKRSPIGQLLEFQSSNKRLLKQTSILTKFQKFNFEHAIVYFQQNLNFQSLTKQAYQAFNKFSKAYIETTKPNVYVSYTLLGSQNFILIIPRRSQYMFGAIGQNSLAFLGYIRTQRQDDYDFLINKQPHEIFSQLTFGSQDQLNKFKEELSK